MLIFQVIFSEIYTDIKDCNLVYCYIVDEEATWMYITEEYIYILRTYFCVYISVWNSL
jgi:hypothetical protein